MNKYLKEKNQKFVEIILLKNASKGQLVVRTLERPSFYLPNKNNLYHVTLDNETNFIHIFQYFIH